MTRSPQPWHERLSTFSGFAKGAILFGALAVAMLLAVAIAYPLHGTAGVIAAMVAGAVCLFAGLNGLAVAQVMQRRLASFNPMNAMLAGMLIRMGMPLMLLVALVVKSHPLLDSGFGYYLIGFYQVMLLVEVLLIVPHAAASTHTKISPE